jgi:hypothetical protein
MGFSKEAKERSFRRYDEVRMCPLKPLKHELRGNHVLHTFHISFWTAFVCGR